jgi:hypothetical protein
MSNYVILAPGGVAQPELRGNVEEKAPGIRSLTANAPGYPDHIGKCCEIFLAILTEGSKISRYPILTFRIMLFQLQE